MPFNLTNDNKPIANIQLLTNSYVDEFNEKLGLTGDTWFFQVIFDSA